MSEIKDQEIKEKFEELARLVTGWKDIVSKTHQTNYGNAYSLEFRGGGKNISETTQLIEDIRRIALYLGEKEIIDAKLDDVNEIINMYRDGKGTIKIGENLEVGLNPESNLQIEVKLPPGKSDDHSLNLLNDIIKEHPENTKFISSYKKKRKSPGDSKNGNEII